MPCAFKPVQYVSTAGVVNLIIRMWIGFLYCNRITDDKKKLQSMYAFTTIAKHKQGLSKKPEKKHRHYQKE